MISAKESKELAMSKYKAYNIKEIEELIQKEATKGHFELTMDGTLDDDAKEELEDAGYGAIVNISQGKPFICIFWEFDDHLF